jgi:hypothetical protein
LNPNIDIDDTTLEVTSTSSLHTVFTGSCCRAGVAPVGVQQGDVICSFTDSDVIAILRRNHERYYFVGRAALLDFEA